MSGFLVEMRNINKSFPGVKALDDVSFQLQAGEVMALLGENGAGKSTLMKILSGVHTADSGEINISGRKITGELTPQKARETGVVMIHQELNMCSQLTVTENIFLGRELTVGPFLADREMRRRAARALDRLKLDLDPDTIVGDLPVSKQQMVEIAKALDQGGRILIMDEPTSALTAREIDDLFGIIRGLRDEGHGLIYISHRLEELGHIVDRVTIMRDGRFITRLDFAETTLDQIIAHMVGREIKEQFPRTPGRQGKKVFEVRNLNAGRLVRDISFDLHEGELVGLAGLMGAGRTEITRALFGADPKDSGEVVIDGKPAEIERPLDAIRAGLALVPEDRKKDGLCTSLSIRENIALPNLDRRLVNPGGWVAAAREAGLVSSTMTDLNIKAASPEMAAGNLSGGNQQKVVVGKWMALPSRVVIFDEPTRGIDVAAKVEIYNLMNTLKQSGLGIMFVSSEMPELLGLADRILVVCDGRITGELSADEASQRKIMELAVKFENKAA